eukprot:scaffold4011_cov197-Ochromonas_danica.AAC.28
MTTWSLSAITAVDWKGTPRHFILVGDLQTSYLSLLKAIYLYTHPTRKSTSDFYSHSSPTRHFGLWVENLNPYPGGPWLRSFAARSTLATLMIPKQSDAKGHKTSDLLRLRRTFARSPFNKSIFAINLWASKGAKLLGKRSELYIEERERENYQVDFRLESSSTRDRSREHTRWDGANATWHPDKESKI